VHIVNPWRFMWNTPSETRFNFVFETENKNIIHKPVFYQEYAPPAAEICITLLLKRLFCEYISLSWRIPSWFTHHSLRRKSRKSPYNEEISCNCEIFIATWRWLTAGWAPLLISELKKRKLRRSLRLILMKFSNLLFACLQRRGT